MSIVVKNAVKRRKGYIYSIDGKGNLVEHKMSRSRSPYQRKQMKPKYIKGKVEMNYGMDNFCYIRAKNGKRVDLTEWMKKLDGKEVHIDVFCTKDEGGKE